MLRVVPEGGEAKGRQRRRLIGGDLETLRAASSEQQGAAAADLARASGGPRDEARQRRSPGLGIDLAQVAADGVIRERDVLRHHQARTPGQVRGPKPSPR